MIQVHGLQYSYSQKLTMSFPDFEVSTGASFLLLGESGSGKTTLLHLIGGLLRSQKGKINILNSDISALSERQLDAFRAKHIGFIFQKNHLLPSLSVRQNLLMAPYLAGLKQDDVKVDAVLSELSLSEKSNARVSELSQGQAQRVAIARALINEPALILADEPTSALDDRNCDRVAGLLLSVTARHKSTLLIATHDQRLKDRFDNRIVIDNTKNR